MATPAHSANADVRAISGGALVVALVVTVAMALDVRAGLALLGATCFTVIALVSLPWGIACWLQLAFVAGSFLELYPALTAGAIVLLISWLGELLRRGSASGLLGGRRWIYVLTPVLAAWLMLGVTWAADPVGARGAWLTWSRSLAVFFVIATTLWEPRHLRLIAGAFVLGAVVSAALGFLGIGAADVTAPVAVQEGRLTGGAGDPNLLAAGLVPALVLAGGLVATSRGPLSRTLALFAIAVIVIGIVLTQSRGGLVGLAVVLAAALVLAPRQRLRIVLAALGVTAVGAAALFASPAALTRITDPDSSGSGRSDLWTVAWRVAEDHPVAGVGLENYKVVAVKYVHRPGSLTFVDLIADQPHVVHNTYLGLVAECGLVGLALFLALVCSALNAAFRAVHRFNRDGNVPQRVQAQAVLIAALGMLATAFFLSAGGDPRLWVLLGLGPALLSASARSRPGGLPRWRS